MYLQRVYPLSKAEIKGILPSSPFYTSSLEIYDSKYRLYFSVMELYQDVPLVQPSIRWTAGTMPITTAVERVH